MICMHLITPRTLLNCITLQNLEIIIVIHHSGHPSLLCIIPSCGSLSLIFRRWSLHSCSHTRQILGRGVGGDVFDNLGFFGRFTSGSSRFGGSERDCGFFVREGIGF